jgi:hypothetical protein
MTLVRNQKFQTETLPKLWLLWFYVSFVIRAGLAAFCGFKTTPWRRLLLTTISINLAAPWP